MTEPVFKFADIGGGMLDQIICACGWQSATYFDGREYAHAEWKRHVATSHCRGPAILPQQQNTTQEKT